MRVIFAGGGTGGHIYPAIAMAREILRRESESKVLFVGTREGVESRILPQEGLELKTLKVMGWKGKKKMERLKALFVLPLALKDSFSILNDFKPDAVIGVGGFVSGPLVLAASLSGRKRMLQEQNSVPGMTNRILGRLVHRVYTAYLESHSYFPKEKVLQTGNPIRKGLGEGGREDALRHFGLSPEKKTVLVLGGSRGAHAVNELVSEMVQKVNWENLSVQFLHQTGEADFQDVSDVYDSSGTPAVVKSYIQEVDQAYAAADIAVSRAGAVALSELCVAGIPMFLIPFPYAADDHQMKNARVTADAGAAEVLVQEGLTPEKLGESIQSVLNDPARLARMREAALKHARPDAVKDVVDDLERIVKGQNVPSS